MLPVQRDDNVAAQSHFGAATIEHGTSFAAPLVTGTLALISRCKPHAPIKEIKRILFVTADRYSNLAEKIIEGKVLNIKAALDLACKNEPMPNSEEPDDTELKKEL